MHPIEIRLECLKLAVEAQAGDPVSEAERMAAFVSGDAGAEAAVKLAAVRSAIR